ncbi:MAG: anti-sigma factor antagonist [Planctomycetota bacterium]|nr:MAG: anti-sigma factor antagonist [Planctomycetota bacterium]
MSELEITDSKVDPGVIVISLIGSLNENTIDILEKAIHKHLSANELKFVIDCEELTYLNSKGVGAFNWAIGGIRKHDGDIKFSRVKGKARNVFDMLGISEFIQIYKTVDEAVEAFADPSVKPEGAESFSYITAKDEKYYHYSWCPEAKKIDKDDIVEFKSRIEVFGLDKTPCPICRPADMA